MDLATSFLSGNKGKTASGFERYAQTSDMKWEDESDNYGGFEATKDVLSNTASFAGSGAAIGAAFGTVVMPGIGSVAGGAAGAVIGGVVGLGMGIWDSIEGNSAEDERMKLAKEYNENQLARMLEENQIRKMKNESIANSFNANTRAENLSNYQKAIGAAQTYSII